jgi:hypothetical protein
LGTRKKPVHTNAIFASQKRNQEKDMFIMVNRLKVSFILIKSLYLTSGRGSLLLAFPVLGDYVRHQEDLLEGAQDLFELHKAGSLRVQIGNKVCTTTPYPAILLS